MKKIVQVINRKNGKEREYHFNSDRQTLNFLKAVKRKYGAKIVLRLNDYMIVFPEEMTIKDVREITRKMTKFC